jgi:glycosyltransferase involved in cell wall biosynthesis
MLGRLRILYANWPEGYVNLRFLVALAHKYHVYAFFFDETNQRIDRVRYVPIDIPSKVKIIKPQDPPLLAIPLYMQLANKKGNVAWALKLLLRALIFRKCVKTLNPDLLIGNGVSGTNPYGLCGALSGHHPFFVLVWGSDILVEAKNSWILRQIAKYILKKADAVIVDNEIKSRAAIELGCKRSKIWKFPWGIDLEKLHSGDNCIEVRRQLHWENSRIVVSTRNHFPIYGIEYLLKAIPIVVEKIPQARFLIIGGGPLTKTLKRIANQLGVTQYTHFTGFVPNQQIPSYLRASDIYVSTSFSDGSSLSLLEALACGLPAVVSDIPGNHEWIQNGRNGFLVPTKDSETLADKIIFLLENDDIRKPMSSYNSELAKVKADWNQNVEVLYNAIEALAESKNKRNTRT